MRFVAIICSFFMFSNLFAQAPPVLQWQKNYGGSLEDVGMDLKILPDGNFIMFGFSVSSDGDIATNHGPAGSSDICLIKSDPAGNVLWKKSYGGSGDEDGYSIIATTDGGFAFVGTTFSNDGDVTGHHGSTTLPDVWVVKLDASGNIVWQKSFGGSFGDYGGDILETSGGFIISAGTNSVDGDVSGNHGGGDLWVFKIDNSGNTIWQRCYGGTKDEGASTINATSDGGFVLTCRTNSTDGDVSNPPASYDAWVLKISATGVPVWDKCIGGNRGDYIGKVLINNDGSYFLAGYSGSNNLPGSFPNTGFSDVDAWVILLDAGGNTIWQKAFGGTKEDVIYDAIRSADGGYLLVGESLSKDGIVCQKHIPLDMWLIKMDNAGNIQWNRTYGGSKLDQGIKLALNAAGECLVLSQALSSDGDLTGNLGSTDFWLTRFSFTGTLIAPSVTIKSDVDSIRCVGASVQFTAFPINGGPSPVYQWKINGVNTGANENPITLDNLSETDIVSCVLTSSASCLDRQSAISNSINLKVRLPIQTGFLPKDTALCSYQRINLGPNTTRFNSYLWNDGSTIMYINVKGPGLYWLQVTDRFQCLGRDSVTIFPKTCIEGVFVPNAFTPNRDGYNDLFMPIMNADVKAYKFVVYDRWGRIVFQTTTLNKGWDGKVNGLPYDTGVFAWQCQYQLDGEEPTAKRGTVLLMK